MSPRDGALQGSQAVERRPVAFAQPVGQLHEQRLKAEGETLIEQGDCDRLDGNALGPKIQNLAEGEALIEQGEQGDHVYLVLDGLFDVLIDGEVVAELGPGAIVGEMASLKDGVRTATVRFRTSAKVAGVSADELDKHALSAVATAHGRDHPPVGQA